MADSDIVRLTQGQIKIIGDKIKGAGGITTLTADDYNYPATNPAYIALWLLPAGIYKISSQEVVTLRFAKQSRYEISVDANLQPIFVISQSNEGTGVVKYIQGFLSNKPIFYAVDSSNGSMWGNASSYGNPSIGIGNGTVLLSSMVADNLTTSNYYEKVLDARQGKILNDKIEGRVIQNAGAPTTSTVGTIGQLLEDTTNGKLYQCTAIDNTDPQNIVYTWTEVGGSSGPTVVQTTGTSTTDVMSQNAVTSMVFADPAAKTKVNIGGDCFSNPSDCVSIKGVINGGICGIAIGAGSYVSSNYGIAIGRGARATTKGQFDIGAGLGNEFGYNNSMYRLLTGLYPGQSEHDAATKGQLDNAVINGGTTQPTTSTVGAVGTQYNCVNNGTPEIYICTDTTGGTYTWTKVF